MKRFRSWLCVALSLILLCAAGVAEEPLQAPEEEAAVELGELDLYAPEINPQAEADVAAQLKAAYSSAGDEAVSAPGLDIEKSASVFPKTVRLGVGERYTIPKGKYKKLSFKSSNKAVAAIATGGKVKGKSTGTAKITVKNAGKKLATITVKVLSKPKSIKLSKSKASVKVGESVTLKATLPSKTASAIKFVSSDKSIAKVSASGKVTGLAPGEAKITAKTYNGKTAACRVTVSARESGVAIRYDANGGSGAPASFLVAPDNSGVISFKHPATKPKRGGYAFLGWLCENNGVYYPIDPAGKSVRFAISTGALRYVAQWMPNSHPAYAPYQVATTLPMDGYTYDIVEAQWKCVQKSEATYWCLHNWYNSSSGFTNIAEGSGYAGFQYGDGQTWAILSIWDTELGTARVDYAMEGSEWGDFGGEGVGKHVKTPYAWNDYTWYTMRIQAWSDSSRTYYEQWIRPEGGSWQRIAVISYSRPGMGFTWDCFFQEDWIGNNQPRSCQLRRYYARRADTLAWSSLDSYRLSNSVNGTSDRDVRYDCDYANVDAGTLWIQTGGDGYEAKAYQMPATLQVSQSAQPAEPGFLIIQ